MNFIVNLVIIFSIAGVNLNAEQPFRILSLDGGGIRGLIEVMALMEIERELGQPISSSFDMIAGASTGGLIALALSVPDAEGKPKFSAQKLLPFYLKQGKEVFHASLFHKFSTGFGIWGPKYQTKGLKNYLRRILGKRMLSEALVPVMVTGYHVEGEIGVEFNSWDAQAFPQDKDCLMREAGLATSAAPVYFDLADVHYPWGVLHGVADGGLYRNNPALLAYINAYKMYPNREIEVYSIGAGKTEIEALASRLEGRGVLHWIAPIIPHLQGAVQEADATILHRLLNEDGTQKYWRADIEIDREFRQMDNASKRNIEYLVHQGKKLIKSPRFKALLEHLKQTASKNNRQNTAEFSISS